MFAKLAVTLIAASLVVAAPLRTLQPRGYAANADQLEPYVDYSERYNALGCQNEHGNAFFDLCCHPLQKGAKLSDRPPQCTPEDDDGNDDDCDDDDHDDPSPPSTTSKTVASTPTPNPKPKPQPTPSPKPQPKPSDGQNSGGFATYYLQNGNAGACGQKHSDSELIVAMDYRRYGDLGKVSSLCGKHVTITNTKNGKSVTCVVADACPSCQNSNSIDMSKGAFQRIATLDEGEVPIQWNFAD